MLLLSGALGYLILVLVIGVLEARGSQDAEGYVLASRDASATRTAASLLATVLGASATLATTDMIWRQGLSGLSFLGVGVPALLVLAWLAPRIRGSRAWALSDLLAAHGDRARDLGALVVSLAWLGVLAAQVVALSSAAELVLPSIGRPLAFGASGVVLVVVVLGGQRAVLRTDLSELLLLLLGLGAAVTWALVSDGGPVASLGGIVAGLSAEPALLDFPLREGFGIEALLALVLVVGLPYLGGPDMYGRLLSSKSARAARRACLGAAGGLVVALAMLVYLALWARAHQLAAPPVMLLGLIPVLPPWVGLLLFVALLAAILSSADTVLFSGVTNFARIARRTQHHESAARWRLRPLIAVYGLLGIGIAWIAPDLISSLLVGYSLFTGALVVPVLVSLFGYRGAPAYVLAGMGLGGLTAASAKVAQLAGGLDASAASSLIIAALAGNLCLTILGVIKGPGRSGASEP